ncbi:hypothetical protein GOBAR_AA03229 [Gossypium barbadense]|uniref:Uncharacterized protein n=1 Tax=Gossypium barbadense TaxID=3634 RepID=A0A2P5YP51_GOSBA|nr:hypothetical protein GOBAR_AA03229 [Gossypium barbadense]
MFIIKDHEIKYIYDFIEILDNDLQLFESIGIKMDGRCSSSVNGSAEINGQSNNWTMDSSGSAVGRKESGTVPPLDKTGGDESCIIVNEAELHCHPHRQGKQKLKTTVFSQTTVF